MIPQSDEKELHPLKITGLTERDPNNPRLGRLLSPFRELQQGLNPREATPLGRWAMRKGGKSETNGNSPTAQIVPDDDGPGEGSKADPGEAKDAEGGDDGFEEMSGEESPKASPQKAKTVTIRNSRNRHLLYNEYTHKHEQLMADPDDNGSFLSDRQLDMLANIGEAIKTAVSKISLKKIVRKVKVHARKNAPAGAPSPRSGQKIAHMSVQYTVAYERDFAGATRIGESRLTKNTASATVGNYLSDDEAADGKFVDAADDDFIPRWDDKDGLVWPPVIAHGAPSADDGFIPSIARRPAVPPAPAPAPLASVPAKPAPKLTPQPPRAAPDFAIPNKFVGQCDVCHKLVEKETGLTWKKLHTDPKWTTRHTSCNPAAV